MNKWKSIWDKKKLENIDLSRNEFDVFCDLKRVNGFDVNVHNERAYFMGFYDEWKKMYARLMEMSENKIRSVYEVGCGSGVNLYMFRNRAADAVLGGIDYSQGMPDIAQIVLGGTGRDLRCGDADSIDEKQKYDLVMADSVFQYFPGIDYAESVLRKMIAKSEKITYIGELHDSLMYEEWLENRRASMADYDKVYEGLNRMFVSREWVKQIAADCGRRTCFTIVDNSEYWNGKYIFNCYIY